MDRVPIKTNPLMFDKTVGNLQKQIADRIGWLDHVFGLVEKVTELQNGRRFVSANIYKGEENYIQVMPCKELGNFCFFVLKDPQEMVGDTAVIAPFYVVFWYNVRKVSSSPDERNRESIKAEILSALKSIRYPHIEWGRIVEEPESIFSDFTYKITDNQYMMSPYSGLRIEGRMKATIPCYEQFNKVCGSFNQSFNDSFDSRCKERKEEKSFNESYNESYK